MEAQLRDVDLRVLPVDEDIECSTPAYSGSRPSFPQAVRLAEDRRKGSFPVFEPGENTKNYKVHHA